MLRTFDGRISDSVSSRTGGLLQAATYVSGRELCSLNWVRMHKTLKYLFFIVSGGATAMGMVAMSDYLDMDSALEADLLLSNYSTSDFAVIANKAELGFNVTISDIFGIVRSRSCFRLESSSLDAVLFLTYA